MGFFQKVADSNISRAVVLAGMIGLGGYTAGKMIDNKYFGGRFFSSTPIVSTITGEVAQDFSSFRSSFVDTSITGLSIMNGITNDPLDPQAKPSEGQAFLMLLANLHEDPPLINGSTRALISLQELGGRGLPPWKFHLSNGRIEIRDDFSRNSALDADVDAATAMVWANSKGYEIASQERIQAMLDMIWPAMNYDGVSAVPGPSEDWGNGPRPLHSVSYFSVFSIESFAGYDRRDVHDWQRVASMTMTVREKVFERGNYRNIPDFIYVSRDGLGRLYFDESTNPAFRSTMGFDAIRTFYRVGADCRMVRDTTLRGRNITLARKSLDAMGNTNEEIARAIQDIELVDGNGLSAKHPEVALAVYTALAYGAANTDSESGKYTGIYNHLRSILMSKLQDGSLERNIRGDYYQRTLIQLSLALIEGGFESQPTSPIYNPERSREIQAFCAEHSTPQRAAEFFLFGQNFGNWGDRDSFQRALVNVKRSLDWLQDCGGPTWSDFGLERRESAEVIGEYRHYTGENMNGVLMYNSAVWMLREALLSVEEELSPKTVEVLNVAMENAGFKKGQKVMVYRDLLQLGGDSEAAPFIRLGLASALIDSYVAENIVEGLTIIDGLKLSGNKKVVPFAYYYEAMALVTQSSFLAIQVNAELAKEKLSKALESVNRAIELEEEAKKINEFYFLKADILHRLYTFTQDRNLLNGAIRAYRTIIASGNNENAAQVKAVLGLSARARDLQEVREINSALELVNAEIEKINSEYDAGEESMRTLDPYFLQLSIEKARLQAIVLPESSMIERLTPIISGVETGRLRGSFERINYFIQRGEYGKAKKDAEQLLTINSALDEGNGRSLILSAEEINKLRAVVMHIRGTLLPKLAQRGEPVEGLVDDFIAEHLNSLGHTGMKGKFEAMARSGAFEEIAEDSERAIEASGLISSLLERGSLAEEREILSMASRILSAIDSNNYGEALSISESAIDKCIDKLNEVSLDEISTKALYEIIEASMWALDGGGKRDEALFIAYELSGLENPVSIQGERSPLFKKIERILVDKDLRGALSAFIATRPTMKSSIITGLLINRATTPENKIELYRMVLGLRAVPESAEDEAREFKQALETNLEAREVLKKIKGVFVSLPGETNLKRKENIERLGL